MAFCRLHNVRTIGEPCPRCVQGGLVSRSWPRSTSATPKDPRCPKCRSHRVRPHCDDTWVCASCGAWFDADPNEGGDYSADPSRRLQRQEERVP